MVESMFLELFRRILGVKVDIVFQPLNLWTNLNSHNLLELMYKDPERWSMVFQSYVMLTMAMAHTKTTNQDVKMMERSFYSAKVSFSSNFLSFKIPLFFFNFPTVIS